MEKNPRLTGSAAASEVKAGCFLGPGACAISVVRRWATMAALYLYKHLSAPSAQRKDVVEGGWNPGKRSLTQEVNASCLGGRNQEGRRARCLKPRVTRGRFLVCALVSDLEDLRSC